MSYTIDIFKNAIPISGCVLYASGDEELIDSSWLGPALVYEIEQVLFSLFDLSLGEDRQRNHTSGFVQAVQGI